MNGLSPIGAERPPVALGVAGGKVARSVIAVVQTGDYLGAGGHGSGMEAVRIVGHYVGTEGTRLQGHGSPSSGRALPSMMPPPRGQASCAWST